MNPDLVKKLADLTNKVDEMERSQTRGLYDSFFQAPQSRQRNVRGPSPPKVLLTYNNLYSPLQGERVSTQYKAS